MLEKIESLAREAGRAILEIYAQPVGRNTEKSDGSPLTDADLASNRRIVSGLKLLTPKIPILSEESSHADFQVRSNWDRYWLVDPLDGTKEFVKRNGEFTVNIALIENGVPVLGVVYAPVLDICYMGAQGQGAFVRRKDSDKNQPIRAIATEAGKPVKVVASRSHSDERTVALLKRLGEYDCVSMGSSLKLCLVAEGAAHFYPRTGPTMEWDTAAAQAVVSAAGGIVCDFDGEPLRYNKPDLHNPMFMVLSADDDNLMGLMKNRM